MGPGIATRLIAAKTLCDIIKTRRSLDECFAVSEDFAELERADQGFARAMVSAALREAGRLEAGFAPFLTRPVNELTREVRALLWLGAVQLWRLNTPPHAAVGETVSAAKAWGPARNASGLVNAVLRKVASDRSHFDMAPAETIWPDWLRTDFRQSIGENGCAALAHAQLTPPDLHLTCRDAEATAAALAGQVIAPGTVAVPMGRVDAMDGFAEGNWWVQDVAAALAARILAPEPGEHIIDLCAAPGGKTLQLAEAGAHVTAVDRSKARLKRLTENLARTGLAPRVDIVAADAEQYRPEAPADRALLDAPCSALGTLRRHPEGAWIKDPAQIAGYPAVQASFLRAAADMVKPGGTVVYCVCTPRREEGADIVDTVCVDGALERDPVTPGEAGDFARCLTPDGDLLTIPGPALAHDAFFVARLRRI